MERQSSTTFFLRELPLTAYREKLRVVSKRDAILIEVILQYKNPRLYFRNVSPTFHCVLVSSYITLQKSALNQYCSLSRRHLIFTGALAKKIQASGSRF